MELHITQGKTDTLKFLSQDLYMLEFTDFYPFMIHALYTSETQIFFRIYKNIFYLSAYLYT